MNRALKRELSPVGRSVISQLVENNIIAVTEQKAYCQDTGITVIFVEVGQDVHIVGGALEDAINQGVEKGWDQLLRFSIADDPIFDRKNTGTNTPAMIYTEIVPGDKMKIIVAPKGGGSAILTPAEGVEGVKKFVVDTCRSAGANACPPSPSSASASAAPWRRPRCSPEALCGPSTSRTRTSATPSWSGT